MTYDELCLDIVLLAIRGKPFTNINAASFNGSNLI